VTSPYDANRDPDQIRREIERTQTVLSNDVDTLTEKVSPGRIAQRRADRARGKLRGWKDAVMGSAHDTPPHHYAGGSRSGPMSATADAASNAASQAAETAQELPQTIRRQAQGNPLAAGLIAFGVGWLASSLLPASRREQELAQQAGHHATELGQPVVDAAKDAAAQMKDNLTEPAQQAVDSVRSTATDAGRTVAEEGRSAAGDVQGEARHGVHRVRDASDR
jgi:hypothetical protein